MNAPSEEPLFTFFDPESMPHKIDPDYLRMAVGFLDTDQLMDVAPYKSFVALVSLTKGQIHKQRKFSFPVQELMDEMGIEHHNYDRLESSIRYLMRTILDFNVHHQDRNPGWRLAQILGPSELKNGVVEFEFTEPVWEKLKDPVVYAYITRKGAYAFSSKYDVALYNWFSRLLVPTYNQVITEENIDFILRDILHIEPKNKTYNTYTRLNDKILSKSIGKINERTNLHVSYEGIRGGRKVTRIRFVIGLKEKAVPKSEPIPQEIRTALNEMVKAGLSLDAKIEARLQEQWELKGTKECVTWLQGIIKGFKAKQESLKSPGGYLRTRLFQEEIFDLSAPAPQEQDDLVEAYLALVLMAVQKIRQQKAVEVFVSYLRASYSSLAAQIAALFDSNISLQFLKKRIDPAEPEQVLQSPSAVGQLYAARESLGYNQEPLSVQEISEQYIEAVLKESRQLLGTNTELRYKIAQSDMKPSDIEALALERLASQA